MAPLSSFIFIAYLKWGPSFETPSSNTQHAAVHAMNGTEKEHILDYVYQTAAVIRDGKNGSEREGNEYWSKDFI